MMLIQTVIMYIYAKYVQITLGGASKICHRGSKISLEGRRLAMPAIINNTSRWTSNFQKLNWSKHALLKNDELHEMLQEKQHLDNDPLLPFSRPEDVPLFADEYPVNLQTISSLEDVNRRLEARQIQMNIGERQFRPNILASGMQN